MEKFKFILLVLLTAVTLLIVSGCSKDSKDSNPIVPDINNGTNNNTGNQATIKINGDVFQNVQLKANDGASYYSPEENSTFTSIVAKAGTDTLLVLLGTAGKSTGTFNWNDTEAIAYLIIPGNEYATYVSVNSGSTTITEFGNVNSYVKGTFAGSLYKAETNEPVDIEGTFSIKRIEDQ